MTFVRTMILAIHLPLIAIALFRIAAALEALAR